MLKKLIPWMHLVKPMLLKDDIDSLGITPDEWIDELERLESVPKVVDEVAEEQYYFMDDIGIYTTKSSSYPDSVWKEYVVAFNAVDAEQLLNKFLDRIRVQGGDQRVGVIRQALGI